MFLNNLMDEFLTEVIFCDVLEADNLKNFRLNV